MPWGWQDGAALAVVASASVYLARKFVPGLRAGKKAGGCAHCPSKSGAGPCGDRPVSITLIGSGPEGGKSSSIDRV